MAEKQITGFGKKAAPNQRVTKDSEHFELLAVQATFDGSGASADFVPAVVVISDSGEVVGRFPASAVVSAGGSAEVTFAPFLRDARGFIRYVYTNTGEWLYVEATGFGGPRSDGITLVAPNNLRLVGRIILEGSSSGIDIDSSATGGAITVNSGEGQLTLESSSTVEVHALDGVSPGVLQVHTDALGSMSIDVGAGGLFIGSAAGLAVASQALGFFGVAPVAQQATPVTLGDVIALLQAYGLAA